MIRFGIDASFVSKYSSLERAQVPLGKLVGDVIAFYPPARAASKSEVEIPMTLENFCVGAASHPGTESRE
jgi:hypothetical protein